MGFVLLVLLVLVADIQAGTVLEEISDVAEYSTFLGWLPEATKTSLNDTATRNTLLIPKNDAVQKFLDKHPDMVDKTAMLNALAQYSLVADNFTLDELKEKVSPATVDGPKLWVSGMDTAVYINNAKATKSMVPTNGQVHEIDAVIYPVGSTDNLKTTIDDVALYSGLKSLVAKVPEAGALLGNDTKMLTVFSPNSAAVTDDMKAKNATALLPVIQNHVVGGSVLFSTALMGQSSPVASLNGNIMVKTMDNMVFVGSGGYWSMVEKTDASTSNGVIHVITGVLGQTPGVNIYQALGLFDSSKFGTTLTKISGSTEVKKALMNATAMYTVFSPQNTAWDDAKVTEITLVEKTLKRHVVSGKLTKADLMTKTEVMTLSGEKLMVSKDNDKVFLEYDKLKAEVTSADNMASNGIIHAIDKVLRTTNSACVTSISLAAAMISLALNMLFN